MAQARFHESHTHTTGERESRASRGGRWIGGGTAVFVSVVTTLLLQIGFQPRTYILTTGEFGRLVLLIVTVSLVGAAFGPRLVRSGRVAALLVGLVAAGATFVAVVWVLTFASVIEFIVRNQFLPDLFITFASTLLLQMLWGGLIVMPYVAGSGLAWAVIGRLVNRVAGGRQVLVGPRQRFEGIGFGRASLTVLAVFIIGAAVVEAHARLPTGSRCLELDGEVALSGAWSPDGKLLAVASNLDPNELGHIRLFSWPRGELKAIWPAWVEDRQTVAVDNEGRVYWVSMQMEPPWSDAIMTAEPGQRATILSWRNDSLRGELLWDLSWSGGELRGRTTNSHEPVRVPLSGPDRGSVLPLDFPISVVGTMWWSPDGRWAVSIADRRSSPILVVGPDASVHPVERPIQTSPRTFAMTPDRRSIVTASWIDRSIISDVATGSWRPILEGAQRWIAVSELGDVAWANDEGYAMPGRPCIAGLDAVAGKLE